MQSTQFCCFGICALSCANTMAYFNAAGYQKTKIYFPGSLPFSAPDLDDDLQPRWSCTSVKKEIDKELPYFPLKPTERTNQWKLQNLQSCKMFDQCFDKILKDSKELFKGSDAKSISCSTNNKLQDTKTVTSISEGIESSKVISDDISKSCIGSEGSRGSFRRNKAQRSGKKKVSRHENAWRGPTYTELITKAIISAPEQRLTLSQIYDWLAENVEYFRERSNYNSSQGWKVGTDNFTNSVIDIMYMIQCLKTIRQ